MPKQFRFKTVEPITGLEVAVFRELLCGGFGGLVEQRIVLGQLLGKNPLSIWRYETNKKISDPVMLRRALASLADEAKITITPRLRYGPRKGAR